MSLCVPLSGNCTAHPVMSSRFWTIIATDLSAPVFNYVMEGAADSIIAASSSFCSARTTQEGTCISPNFFLCEIISTHFLEYKRVTDYLNLKSKVGRPRKCYLFNFPPLNYAK